LFRRDAFLSVGGWFEPFFHLAAELDLALRLIAGGWKIRYLPGARFEHMRESSRGEYSERSLYYRTRNHLWFFWVRFPPTVAMRRIPAYFLYFLIESIGKRQFRTWGRAVRDAWVQRAVVADARAPLPRPVVRLAERDRGRRITRLLIRGTGRRVIRSARRGDDDARASAAV
jgi:GT2 family glycosyltransferase